VAKRQGLSAGTSDVEPALEEIAAELYRVRPDEFAAARDDRVRQARAEGRQPLARELSRLRRPTQSAWLINLLWRDQQEVMEQLLQLGAELSRAQAQASGPELQRLTAVRRELEAALIRRARALATQAGVDIGVATEREAQETLSAALARTDVADEVRTGRLVKPAFYAGFGSLPQEVPAPEGPRSAHSTPSAPARPPRAEVVDLQAAQRARERRQEAEGRVHEARAEVEAAAGTLAERGRAAEAAHRLHQELRGQVDQLQQQLRQLDEQVALAENSAIDAARRRDEAKQAHEAALRTLERADQELKEIG
jgi:hypothetical protein